MNDTFDRIYEQNIWGNAESRSGDGSDTSGTERIRDSLAQLVKELNIRSMLDLPCGDFNWMQLMDLEGIEYIGADVVERIVDQNQERYGQTNIRFRRLDARSDSLPRVDLILCRDMLVHLSFADCSSALANFRMSGTKYLLTTTFTARDPNKDIVTGEWRPLNLQRPPFEFPRPMRLIVEYCQEWNGFWADKCLALWRLADLDMTEPESRVDQA